MKTWRKTAFIDDIPSRGVFLSRYIKWQPVWNVKEKSVCASANGSTHIQHPSRQLLAVRDPIRNWSAKQATTSQTCGTSKQGCEPLAASRNIPATRPSRTCNDNRKLASIYLLWIKNMFSAVMGVRVSKCVTSYELFYQKLSVQWEDDMQISDFKSLCTYIHKAYVPWISEVH